MAFVSEEQAVVLIIFNIPIRMLALGGKEPKAFGGVGTCAKGFPVFVMMDIEVVPIVHSATPNLFIGDFKTEGMNQVQAAPGNGTEASDITGVLRDLGIVENEVQHGISI